LGLHEDDLTPGALMGRALRKRLEERAGLTFNAR